MLIVLHPGWSGGREVRPGCLWEVGSFPYSRTVPLRPVIPKVLRGRKEPLRYWWGQGCSSNAVPRIELLLGMGGVLYTYQPPALGSWRILRRAPQASKHFLKKTKGHFRFRNPPVWDHQLRCIDNLGCAKRRRHHPFA